MKPNGKEGKMKKLLCVMLPILILFSSCETLDNLTESINELFSGDKKTEDCSKWEVRENFAVIVRRWIWPQWKKLCR